MCWKWKHPFLLFFYFFFPFCSVHTCIHVDQEKMRLSHKGLKAFPAVPHLSASPGPIHRRHHHLLRESYFMSNLQTPERGAIIKSLYLLVLCLCGSQDSVMMLKVLLIHQMFVIQGVDYLKYDNCFNLGIPPKERFFNLPWQAYMTHTQYLLVNLNIVPWFPDIPQCVMLLTQLDAQYSIHSVNGSFPYSFNIRVPKFHLKKFISLFLWNLLGALMTLHYGLARLGIAGVQQMTSMIHGQGSLSIHHSIFIFCPLKNCFTKLVALQTIFLFCNSFVSSHANLQ